MKMKPSQSSLRDASSPEERAFRHLAVTLPKPPPPSGEVDANEVSRRKEFRFIKRSFSG